MFKGMYVMCYFNQFLFLNQQFLVIDVDFGNKCCVMRNINKKLNKIVVEYSDIGLKMIVQVFLRLIF